MNDTFQNNKNKQFINLEYGNIIIRLHVFEPEESTNKEDWYKDLSTFSFSKCFEKYWHNIGIGDIVEDDCGTRFRILSKHWKFYKNEEGEAIPVIEFTGERYIRRGKQNPYEI